MSDNNSTRKLDVGFFRKPDGARWVYVDLLKYGPPHTRFIVSFRDLHRIIQALAVCEDEKYPPPAKGRIRLLKFLRDAVREHDFDKLAAKYKIPERDRDTVINTNGAILPRPKRTRDAVPLMTADDINWG
jgi:hypothetical protein